jgi:hypothetical protein
MFRAAVKTALVFFFVSALLEGTWDACKIFTFTATLGYVVTYAVAVFY